LERCWRDPRGVPLLGDQTTQHFRAQRGELGKTEVQVPGVHYGVRTGDRVALIDQHHEPRPRTHRERQSRPGARHHPRWRCADRVRCDRAQAHTRRGQPRPPAVGLRAAHPPRAGRDRHPHARRYRRMADKQGARLRRGVPRPARAPTGSSPGKTSASKDKTPTASNDSQSTCAEATHKHLRSRTPSCPTATTAPTITGRSHPAAPAAYRASSAPPSAE
jgi:hypothetical protein